MKSLKTTFLALALVAGVAGAFATKAEKAPMQAPKYDWSSTSIAPNNPSSSLLDKTRSQAVSYFGCDAGANVCANGIKVSGAGPSTQQLNFGL